MPNRRDQLLSYQFMVQRSTSALVVHDTDPVRPPFRGAAGATFASVLVAAIAILGVLVYGMIVRGGNNAWRSPDVMIVERETGARYVFRDGVLYPVANQTSARLLGAAQTVEVSRASLASTPRGGAVGIVGAPEAPPQQERMAGGPWLFCVSASKDDAGIWGTTSVLTIGAAAPAGTVLGDQGLLVRSAETEGPTYLIWHGRRHAIRDPDVVLTALTWRERAAAPVDDAWLNAMALGAPIGRVVHESFGSTSMFAGVSAGRVFFVQTTSGREYYVALDDGLAPITALQADILRGDPQVNRDQRPAEEIQAAAVAMSAITLRPEAGADAPPESAPMLAQAEASDATCASFTSGATEAQILQMPAPSSPPQAARTSGTSLIGARLADYVVVAPGSGALVAVAPGEGTDGTVLLVAEPGMAYPIPPEAMLALGYEGVAPLSLPSMIVARVPLGPALDPAAAALPVLG